MYVSRIFKSWRWSYRIPERKQLLKYTKANILYYGTYITSIYNIPWERLKFVDEAHFISKDLHRRRAIGLKGSRTHVVVKDGLINTSLSLTIMTSLSNTEQPIVCSARNNSNTEVDFAGFILYCIQDGHLQRGDLLVMDNASVHLGAGTIISVLYVCKEVGVRITFLPNIALS